MRMFWAIIAVLVLFGGGWIGVSFARQRAQTARAAAEIARADAERALAEARQVEDQQDVLAKAAEVERAKRDAEAKAEQDRLAAVAKAQEEELRARMPDLPVTVTPTPATAPVDPAPDAPKPVSDAPKPAADLPKPTAPAPATDPRSDEKPAAGPSALPTGIPQTIGGYEVEAGSFELRPDGALLVDGKYIVKGQGTLESPYEIAWEMLTSVEHLFDPRSGKKKIPGRVAFLHDRHVRMNGFISFPIMVKQPRELLVMLNQWDGCCIGVPPTPYDAVEVALTKAVTGNNLLAIAGGVVGVFQVKPYVMGDWLVGLYVLDKGDFSPTEFGGPGGY